MSRALYITCAFGLYIWCAGADPADAGVFKSRKYCITPNSQTYARKEGSNHERSKTVNATLSPSCLMVVLCLIPGALTCHCLSSEEESSQHQTSEDGIFFCSLCEVEVRLTFEVKLSFSDFKLDVMSWKFEIN
ncbi:putative protein S-acyltransferase [Helianthus annuus]|nr:putative protein S-acyltransferase [Helianthus annuus]